MLFFFPEEKNAYLRFSSCDAIGGKQHKQINTLSLRTVIEAGMKSTTLLKI